MADLRKGPAGDDESPAGYQPGYPPPGYQPGYPPPGYQSGYPPPGYPAHPPAYPPAYSPYGAAPGYQRNGAPAQPLPLQQMPPSNIGWAIAAIFTFWPLAIPAFIFASRVESYWFQGNAFGAQKASHDARTYGLIAVIVGVVLFVIGLLIFVFAFVFVVNTVHEVRVR